MEEKKKKQKENSCGMVGCHISIIYIYMPDLTG